MSKHVIFTACVVAALASGAIAFQYLRERKPSTLKREVDDLALTRAFARELLHRCPRCTHRMTMARLAHVTTEGVKRMVWCEACGYQSAMPERFYGAKP